MIDFMKEFMEVGDFKSFDMTTLNFGELLKGVQEEMEHTTNKVIALKIVLDHLAKDPEYYTKLKAAGL